jgi:serine/threonine protein phosphatase 1
MCTRSVIVHFDSNPLGSDYVLGDLHGQFERLMALLSKLHFDYQKDRLFALGDLIDRGPDSEKCIELLNAPWFYSIKGNHEDLLCRSFIDETFRPIWIANGGGWAGSLSREQFSQYTNAVSELPLVITIGSGSDRINLLHAEYFGTDQDLDAGNYSQKVIQQLLWGRQLITEPSKYRKLSQLSKTYCGHSVVEKPLKIASQIYIDTGAGFIEKGGKLTVVNISENRFYSI